MSHLSIGCSIPYRILVEVDGRERIRSSSVGSFSHVPAPRSVNAGVEGSRGLRVILRWLYGTNTVRSSCLRITDARLYAPSCACTPRVN